MVPKTLAWATGLALLAGCGLGLEAAGPLPPDHPANGEAKEQSYSPPPNLLRGEVPAVTPKEPPSGEHPHHEHDGHEKGKASSAAYPLTTCPVSGQELGKMGKPVVISFEGREVRFCCANCIAPFKKDPVRYLKILDEAAKASGAGGKTTDPHAEHEEKK